MKPRKRSAWEQLGEGLARRHVPGGWHYRVKGRTIYVPDPTTITAYQQRLLDRTSSAPRPEAPAADRVTCTFTIPDGVDAVPMAVLVCATNSGAGKSDLTVQFRSLESLNPTNARLCLDAIQEAIHLQRQAQVTTGGDVLGAAERLDKES